MGGEIAKLRVRGTGTPCYEIWSTPTHLTTHPRHRLTHPLTHPNRLPTSPTLPSACRSPPPHPPRPHLKDIAANWTLALSNVTSAVEAVDVDVFLSRATLFLIALALAVAALGLCARARFAPDGATAAA